MTQPRLALIAQRTPGNVTLHLSQNPSLQPGPNLINPLDLSESFVARNPLARLK